MNDLMFSWKVLFNNLQAPVKQLDISEHGQFWEKFTDLRSSIE